MDLRLTKDICVFMACFISFVVVLMAQALRQQIFWLLSELAD